MCLGPGVAGLAAGGLFAGIQFGQQARDLQRWSNILGISVEQVDALNRAARRFASDGDVLFEALIATVDKANAAILQGEESERDFFREFGISARRFRSLDTEGQFNAIANALDRIEDPSLRAAVASALFGDEAVKLLPVLEDIQRRGLAGFTEEAARTAQLLDGPASDALIRYDEAWQRVRDRLESAGRRLLVYVEPIFQDFVNWLEVTGIPRISDFTQQITDFIQGEGELAGQTRVEWEVEITTQFGRVQELGERIVDFLIGAWEWAANWWENSAAAALIRLANDFLFQPLEELLFLDISIAQEGAGNALSERILTYLRVGLLGALALAGGVIAARVGRFGAIFRLGLIGGLIGLLEKLDPSGITSAIVGILLSALALAPARIAGVVSAAANRIAVQLALALGAGFGQRQGAVIGLEIVRLLLRAVEFVAGQAGISAVATQFQFLGRAIVNALLMAIRTLPGSRLAGDLLAWLLDGIELTLQRLATSAVGVRVTEIASRLIASVVARFAGSTGAGLATAVGAWILRAIGPVGLRTLAGAAFRVLLGPIGWIWLATDIVLAIANAFGLVPYGSLWSAIRDGFIGGYARLGDDFLSGLTNVWKAIGVDIINALIAGINSGIREFEELLNGIIAATNTVISGLNSVNPFEDIATIPAVNLRSIGAVSGGTADLRRDQTTFAGYAGGGEEHSLITTTDPAFGVAGTGVRPVTVTIEAPTGSIWTQEALDLLGRGIADALSEGIIGPEGVGG